MARGSKLGSLGVSRRDWLKVCCAGAVGYSVSGWLETVAAAAAKDPKRHKSCILLWMNGGPSQMDTFDLKPGHANGGQFKEIDTAVSGIRISEHLPKIATHMKEMAIIRTVTSKEADHGRATHLMRTGQPPMGAIQYPSVGSLVSKELGNDAAELPDYVAIAPYRQFNPEAYGAGFLGPKYAPLIVGDVGNQAFQQQQQQPGRDNSAAMLKVENLQPPKSVNSTRMDSRLDLLREMDESFHLDHPGVSTQGHLNAYERAARMMRTKAGSAFDLDEEKPALRDAYGRNIFGQGCLLARRLVERGVPFVEVNLTYLPGLQFGGFGWDTHNDIFNQVKQLSKALDPAWATLMEDLKSRGLLDSTLIVWMGEFGRTPKLSNGGRDHWSNNFSTVLAGGGIKGGQVIGSTSKDGMEIKDRPVTVNDFLATVVDALGVDHTKQNASNVGRPIRIVDQSAEPIKEVLP